MWINICVSEHWSYISSSGYSTITTDCSGISTGHPRHLELPQTPTEALFQHILLLRRSPHQKSIIKQVTQEISIGKENISFSVNLNPGLIYDAGIEKSRGCRNQFFHISFTFHRNKIFLSEGSRNDPKPAAWLWIERKIADHSFPDWNAIRDSGAPL